MEWNKQQDIRLAVIAKLVSLAPAGYLGRTALMKFCYLLQTIRHVPLGYRFTLYSYGPFDSDVLSDLGTAENLGAVKSSTVHFGNGYGYRIQKSSEADTILKSNAEMIQPYLSQIDWVIAEFGQHLSADLELESTIVFVDREAAKKEEHVTINELASRVKEVKPHFGQSLIAERASALHRKQMLESASLGVQHA